MPSSTPTKPRYAPKAWLLRLSALRKLVYEIRRLLPILRCFYPPHIPFIRLFSRPDITALKVLTERNLILKSLWLYSGSDLSRILALALIYALLGIFVIEFFSANDVVPIVWPCSGVALAALLLGGQKYRPGIFIGAFAANMLTSNNSIMSISITTGNTLEALIGLRLLAKNGFKLSIPYDYFRLLCVGVVAASANALPVTLVVTNLPLDDAERIGRMRDHLALLVEGADAKVVSMLADRQCQSQAAEIIKSAAVLSKLLEEIKSQQAKNQEASLKLTSNYLSSLEDAFFRLGLSDQQETELLCMAKEVSDRLSALTDDSTQRRAIKCG